MGAERQVSLAGHGLRVKSEDVGPEEATQGWGLGVFQVAELATL